VSVSENVILPAQPTLGLIEYVPLGGDGWVAPQSAFVCDVQVTGDGTGGSAAMTIFRDERFEHLIQFMSLESNITTAMEFRFDLARSVQTQIHNVGTSTVTAVVGAELACQIWTPPAMVDPIQFRARTDNADTFLNKFKCVIYNFNIRASEKVPLGVMFASLPRTSSSI